MLKRPDLPELSLLSSASPFKKKKPSSKPPATNQNSLPTPQFLTKMISGKNSRNHKSFGTPVHPNTVHQTTPPLKSILKKGNGEEDEKLQEEMLLKGNLETIDVDDNIPRGKTSEKETKETLDPPRPKFFSTSQETPNFEKLPANKKVQQKISRKRFLSMIGEHYPNIDSQQERKQFNDTNKKEKSKERRFSLREEILLPKNYDTVREYLDNNCLNLEGAIKDRMRKYQGMRGKKNANRQM